MAVEPLLSSPVGREKIDYAKDRRERIALIFS
jgi:hypothetical protein